MPLPKLLKCDKSENHVKILYIADSNTPGAKKYVNKKATRLTMQNMNEPIKFFNLV